VAVDEARAGGSAQPPEVNGQEGIVRLGDRPAKRRRSLMTSRS